MTTQRDLDRAARRLAALLELRQTRIVFAESCTGGLVSATLTRVPGISARHCGSAVVYQLETKRRWLGISPDLLEDPGPVSREVASAMAAGVLERTPRADVAVSVTGHLGPDAPRGQDGLVFVGLASRGPTGTTGKIVTRRRRLAGGDGEGRIRVRHRRQREAALLVLEAAAEFLDRGKSRGRSGSV
jgi:nicotinamide-nucleotide amidase